MIEQQIITSNEQIMEAMIELTGMSRSHRVILAGSNAFYLYLTLSCQYGFSRVATTENCRIARGQHDVALVAGAQSSPALEALLARVVPFLHARATLGIWVDSHEHHRSRKLSALLGQLGFRIEAGAKCENGFAFSARRNERSHVANSA